MKFIKNNFCTICAIALFTLLMFTGTASADVMESATNKAAATFGAVKKIMFVLGGFGLVGVAFGAIFGKIKWTWFAGLAVGLAILAAANSIVQFSTVGGSMQGVSDEFS